MITLAWYFLKVIICSGILCGYYFLALRNKAFHRWNRFYLLAAIVISLLVPIMKINIFSTREDKGTIVQVLQTISYGDEAVIEYSHNSGFQLSTENIIQTVFLLISAVFLFIFLLSLDKIKRLRKKYPETRIEDVSFINTNEKGTPFSFFKSIFWNQAIDLHSKPGQQIFNHEIAHIKEKHSYDKIFMNIVLVFFWINPFFWLMRKELYMIHEFIADKEALEDSDINSFAEMVLQTVYPGQHFSSTNNFFYSPIKRRILMLAKNKNPKVSYISRLLVLPLAAMVFFAFTLKVKTPKYETIVPPQTINDIPPNNPALITSNNDTIPPMFYKNKKVTGLGVNDSKNTVNVKYGDGSKETITKEEAKKRGFILPPPPPPGLPPSYFKSNVLFVIDGKISTDENAKTVDPKNIKSINILKDEEAIKKYGEKGNKGAIEIKTKYNIPPNTLIIIDGKKSSKEELDKIHPDDIESVTALKGDAFQKYGIIAINGTIEIFTKKNSTMDSTEHTVPNKIFAKVDKEAQFPSGAAAWQKYISGVIMASPDSFTTADYGTCVVKFIVDKDGKVSDVKATTMQGTHLARVSIDAIKKGPKWIPASQNGYTVAAYRLQPVTLKNADQKKDSKKSAPEIIFNPPNASIDGQKVFTKIEKQASFPGGQSAWLKYISRVIQKNGNELIADKNSEGVCKVRFIVSKDGKVSNVEAVTKRGTKLAEVAVNAIKNGPRWIPGMQNGHSVNSYVIQPVRFFLNDKNNSIIITEPE